jgi:hypothetical protein
MKHHAITLLLLAAVATTVQPAEAQASFCNGPEGQLGVTYDDGTTATGCIHECRQVYPVHAGVNLTVNGEPVVECQNAELCPIQTSFGIIVNGQPYCVTPNTQTCGDPYLPTPTGGILPNAQGCVGFIVTGDANCLTGIVVHLYAAGEYRRVCLP